MNREALMSRSLSQGSHSPWGTSCSSTFTEDDARGTAQIMATEPLVLASEVHSPRGMS
jgi:hypothetical protein